MPRSEGLASAIVQNSIVDVCDPRSPLPVKIRSHAARVLECGRSEARYFLGLSQRGVHEAEQIASRRGGDDWYYSMHI